MFPSYQEGKDDSEERGQVLSSSVSEERSRAIQKAQPKQVKIGAAVHTPLEYFKLVHLGSVCP